MSNDLQPIQSNSRQFFTEKPLPSGQTVLVEQDDLHTYSGNQSFSHENMSSFPSAHYDNQAGSQPLMAAQTSTTTDYSGDEFNYWTEDSDYITSHSLSDDNYSTWFSHDSSNEAVVLASSSDVQEQSSPSSKSPSASIPPVPFKMPPKLKSVEQVMNENTGTDIGCLRQH